MPPHALHPGAIQRKEGIKFCYLATLDKVKEGFGAGTAASSVLLGAMVPRMIMARAVNPVGAACTVIGVLGVAYNGYQFQKWA